MGLIVLYLLPGEGLLFGPIRGGGVCVGGGGVSVRIKGGIPLYNARYNVIHLMWCFYERG